MKKYRVKVNGKLYEVELEAIEEVKGSIATPAPQAAPSVSAPVATGEGTEYPAPIGGKVLDIRVKVGQQVKKGEVLCVIEAMKLENEVKASKDMVIKEIKVSKGSMVGNKEPLFIVG